MTSKKEKNSVEANMLPLIIQQDKVLVDARLLHQRLQSGHKFTDWIKIRIEEFGFIENQDFFASEKTEAVISRHLGGSNKKDYHLTLDMAKELAMLERNDVGRNIRRYFIAKEKEVRGAVTNTLAPVTGLFKGIEKQNINNRKLFAYKAYLLKIGMNAKSGGASTRVAKYPQHFVKFNNLLYITEEFALHLHHQRQVTLNRTVLKNAQPVIPLNFGQTDLFLPKGGQSNG